MENIYTNIRELRTYNKMTQEAVASYLNIDRSTLTKYESGDRNIPLKIAEKIANLFGVELYDLYEKDEQLATTNVVLSFRADELNNEDLESIAQFNTIVKNYIKMCNLLDDEKAR